MVINGYDYIEYYVGSSKMVAYWFAKALGLKMTGYRGPETGVRDRVSYYLTKNNLKFVITSPLSPECSDVIGFINKHGDGIKRWAMQVKDVKACLEEVVKNGGIPAEPYKKLTDSFGFVEQGSIKLYDDSEIVFINRDNYNSIFKPGFSSPFQELNIECKETGLLGVDHIVGNVRVNEMNHWAEYFNRTLGFETFVDFKPGDIGTKYSALLSKVVRSKGDKIKNPINEPYEGLKKSQIEEYIEHYHGTGIQHIAINCENIVESISALRKNGVEFLSIPDSYYDNLRSKNYDFITENIDDLQRENILCDVESQGYLLQLFTKPIGDRPTFFFEFIQRKNGSQGFGKGNFQSLFESIEQDQKLRGNLEKEPSAD